MSYLGIGVEVVWHVRGLGLRRTSATSCHYQVSCCMVSSLGGLAAIISWQQTERQSSSVTGKDCSKGWLAVTALCRALEKLQTDATHGHRALMESQMWKASPRKCRRSARQQLSPPQASPKALSEFALRSTRGSYRAPPVCSC